MGKLHNNGKPELGRNLRIGNTIRDHDKEFVGHIVDHILDELKIDWNSRYLVTPLLVASLEKVITDKGGLLDQHSHLTLDTIADSIKTSFHLDSELAVDYTNADHAKFNSIIEAIMRSYPKKLESIQSDILIKDIKEIKEIKEAMEKYMKNWN